MQKWFLVQSKPGHKKKSKCGTNRELFYYSVQLYVGITDALSAHCAGCM